jgi:hypothetical protein
MTMLAELQRHSYWFLPYRQENRVDCRYVCRT